MAAGRTLRSLLLSSFVLAGGVAVASSSRADEPDAAAPPSSENLVSIDSVQAAGKKMTCGFTLYPEEPDNKVAGNIDATGIHFNFPDKSVFSLLSPTEKFSKGSNIGSWGGKTSPEMPGYPPKAAAVANGIQHLCIIKLMNGG